MDNRYYEKVIGEMKPLLDEQGFTVAEDGSYNNDTRSIIVAYNEARQMYTLSVANIVDGNKEEYSEVNAWLFDDSQNAKDAASVGIDFTNSLRKSLGIKLKRNASGQEIELPTVTKSGSVTISGFTKKMLDFFPTVKDDYKNDVAEKGNFLYLNFYGTYVVPKIKEVLESGNKKQIKKLFDILCDAYVKGDKETVNSVVAVLCASSYKNDKVKDTVLSYLSDNTHFKSSFENFLPLFTKNKKLISAMIK